MWSPDLERRVVPAAQAAFSAGRNNSIREGQNSSFWKKLNTTLTLILLP
jgi:hypothetical protein